LKSRLTKGGTKRMEQPKPLLPMPIKAAPYRHQIEAFNFVCTKFGLVHGGEAVENKVPQMRESDQPKAK